MASGQARPPRRLAGSIRWATVGVAAVSVLVVFVVFITFWTLFTINQTTQELSGRVVAIAKGMSGIGPIGAGAAVRQRLFRVEAGLIGATLYLTDADGQVLVASSGSAQRVRLPVRGLSGSAEAISGVSGIPGLGSAVVVASPVTAVSEYPAASWLVAVEPLRELNRSRGWVGLLLACCAALALGIAWIAGGVMAGRIAAPIVRLRDASRAVTAGDWGHQVPIEGAEEVATLAGSFNVMSARVADAYRAQRDFVGDVSHELRTPITSIQGFSGALLDGTVTDDAERQRYLGVIRDESLRLGELTTTLLSLAQLDSGSVTLAAVPVDTAALAEALKARHAPRAAEREVALEVGALAGEPLGDPERLLEALSALVDNAINYTPAGGGVSVEAIAAEPGRWAVAVDDSGPGIPAQRREEVFGRFSRLDRSRAKRSGGAGLGLAICLRIVELMDGSVRVDDGPLGGARFVIDLPGA